MEAKPQISYLDAVAFGDSVMWGQGLLHGNKFATLIARRVYGIDMDKNSIVAHSGAIIDTGAGSNSRDVNPAESAPIYGEIPRTFPSIFRQVLTFGLPLPINAIANDDIPPVSFPNVRVVFVNGGINDLEAFELVAGNLGRLDQLEERVDIICRRRFLELLTLVRQRFPSAEIMACGYHFIFSQESLKSLVSVLGPFFDEGDELADKFRRGIRQCSWFMGLAAAAHQQAVDSFNRNDLSRGGPGALYVPSLQGPEHANFTDRTLSWTIENRSFSSYARRFVEGIFRKDWIELINIRSNDEVTRLREGYCEAYAIDARGGLGNETSSDAKCQLAAVFHPNAESAARVTEIAEEVHREFTSPPSFLTALGERQKSLSGFAARWGFERPFSYRQLFGTAVVNSVRLDGTIEAGTNGSFPYHLLFVEFELRGRPHRLRYSLNDLLPFIRGFADRNDDIFPGAYGRVLQVGGYMSVEPIEEDTPFSFFAYPTRTLFIHEVERIYIGTEEIDAGFSLLIKDLRLIINGRRLKLTTTRAIVQTGGSRSIL